MMQSIAPTEKLLRRTTQALLLATVLVTILTTLLHARQVNTHPLNLVIPPTVGLVMLGLSIYLYRFPASILPVIWFGVLTVIVALIIPAWFFPLRAWRGDHGSLVETLPPISAALILPLVVLTVFLRPRHSLAIAATAWLLIAGPILLYLLMHQSELVTPRGQDLMVTLGPVTMLLVLFIPFQRAAEQLVSKLQSDRLNAQALADRDVLTGLYNRRAGERLLEGVLSAPQSSDVLILFDLDHFKTINDTYGHPAGDDVLREVAQRCAALLRKHDMFARWGGEEFLILIRDMEDAGVLRVANDLRNAIAAPPMQVVGTVTASFGVAHFQRNDTLLSWVTRADGALYTAKSGGRDRVVRR